MPWQTDGKRWHTEDRIVHKGKPCRWEGDILTWVEEKIHALGEFAETNWKQPTIVEIAAPTKTLGWFFHVHTGMEWLVRLVFRVGKNTFKQEDLDRKLGFRRSTIRRAWRSTAASRASTSPIARGRGKKCAMLVHRLSEIQTPAFDDS